MTWLAGFLLSFLLHSASYSHALKFTLSSEMAIAEEGVEYSQLVDYDPTARVMRIEVPAHNLIDHSVSLIDIKKNIEVVYTPRVKLCQVSLAPEDFDAEEMMKFSVQAQLDGNKLSHQNATVVFKSEVLLRVMGKKESNNLPTCMQELCSGSRIVKIETNPVSEAELSNTSFMLYPHQQSQNGEHLREKRRLNLIRCTHPGTADLCTTAQDWGQRCRWMTVGTKTATERQIQHIRSTRFNCVLCCLPYRAGAMCKCDDIQTKSQFKSCQPLTMNNTRLRLNWAFLTVHIREYPCRYIFVKFSFLYILLPLGSCTKKKVWGLATATN